MFCQKCGKKNSDDANFCFSCGAKIAILGTSDKKITPVIMPKEQMTFSNSISTCLDKYCDFNGRASRSEFWWFYLFNWLLNWALWMVDPSGIVPLIVSLMLLLPYTSVTVRRLHDTNRSGWYLLFPFTIIGLIPFIIWLASKSDNQSNDYGNPA